MEKMKPQKSSKMTFFILIVFIITAFSIPKLYSFGYSYAKRHIENWK
jgi:hypothetical protein